MKLIYKVIIFFLICNAAYAAPVVPDISRQDISNISTVSNPSLIPQRFEQGLPPVQKKLAPAIHQPAPAPSAFGKEAEKIKFKLTRVIIKGNTVFSTQELESLFTPYYNKTISLGELQDRVNEITVKYRSKGYILSRAILPPQAIKNGVVEVEVIEGFVSEITMSGNPGWVSKTIRKYAQPVLDERPLNMRTLERAMLLINDLPGVNAKAVLTPSKTTSAASELTIEATQKKLNSFLAYDNYGTRYLGPQEISAGFGINSLLPGASDAFNAMTVPDTQELQYYQYTHTNPIGGNGAKFTLGGNYTSTKAGFVLSDLDVVSRSTMWYGDISYPWIRSRTENFFIHGTANYINVNSTILTQPFYNDLIRSLVLGGEYSAIDHWRGVNDVKLDLEQGFDILGAQQHLMQSRPLGVPNYTKLNLQLSRLQALPWQLSFLAATRGQYAFEPLLTTVQYAYGGPDWGRGYDPAEIIGDDGLAFKLELRKDSGYGLRFLNAVQYYTFYDAGIIWNRDGIDLPPKQSATSIGLGARLTFLPQLSGNVFYAKPLTHSINTQVLMNKDPLKPRIFFQLAATF